MIKNLLFLIFVSLVACQSVENVKQPEDAPPLKFEDVFETDTAWKPVTTRYTHVRPDKAKAFGIFLAKDIIQRKYTHLIGCDQATLESLGEDMAALNKSDLMFQEIDGEIYMNYNTETLAYPILLRYVEQYLEWNDEW